MLRFYGNAVPIDEALDIDPATVRLRLFLTYINACLYEQVAKAGVKWQFVGHCLMTLYQQLRSWSWRAVLAARVDVGTQHTARVVSMISECERRG